MKLGSVTIIGKRNTATSKKVDDEGMLANCNVIAIFPIYGQFGAISKPHSGCISFKIYIFINSNLLSYKTENRTKRSLTRLSYYCFK